MQTTEELRLKLYENYEKLENGTRTIKLGNALANTAGKIIALIAVELNYNLIEYNDKIELIDK